MSMYRSKPSEIEAVQWVGDNHDEVAEFLREAQQEQVSLWWVNPDDHSEARLMAGKDGAQGFVPLPVGHWIVRSPGDLTDHWPVDPDYFAAKYEPA